MFLHVDSDDPDQTGQMPWLIWVFAGCTCHFGAYTLPLRDSTRPNYNPVILSHQPQLWSDISKIVRISSLLCWCHSWWGESGNVFIGIVIFRITELQIWLILSFRLCCYLLCCVESQLSLLKRWNNFTEFSKLVAWLLSAKTKVKCQGK